MSTVVVWGEVSKSVTELLYYLGLLETLVFTCVIHSGLIQSLFLGKRKKNLQNLAAFRMLRAKKSCTKAASEQCGKFGPRGIWAIRSHIQCIYVKVNCVVKCKKKKTIAWPWAPLWHDDTLSTLMVHDGIKALSGGHSRCSKPRPWVALGGRRAVIYVPNCQSWPPPPP